MKLGRPRKGNKYEFEGDILYLYPSNKPEEKYILDLDDYEKIKNHTWYIGANNYLITRINNKTMQLHRFILNAKDNERISFIDTNPYNCRKYNLEIKIVDNTPSIIYKENNITIIIANNTKNLFYFDICFYDKLKGYSWKEDLKGYLFTHLENNQLIQAHQYIIGKIPKGMVIDHIDQSPKNNLLSNLRITTVSVNGQNSKLHINNKSGFIGVSYFKRDDNWEARIQQNNKSIYLGRYSNPIKAAKVYDKKALELYGDLAQTNKRLNLYN